MSAPRPLLAAFGQALREAWAGGAGAVLPASFFAGAVMLVPLSVGNDPEQLSSVASGALWIALALASLVTMERLFQADLEDGALELWLTSDVPAGAIAATKTLAHWLVSGLPLVLMSPVLELVLGGEPLLLHAAAYGLGGIGFFFWGGMGAALAASVRRGGLLIALIALPFYVPVAIFGAGATADAVNAEAAFLFLAATTLITIAIAPFAMGTALRLSVD